VFDDPGFDKCIAFQGRICDLVPDVLAVGILAMAQHRLTGDLALAGPTGKSL
jgi:hypothetical protein